MRFRRFLKTLLIRYSLGFGAVFLAIAIPLYFFYNGFVEKTTLHGLDLIAQKTLEQVESLFIRMDDTALFTVSNPSIQKMFEAADMGESNLLNDNYEARKTITDLLRSLSVPEEHPTRIAVYDRAGNRIGIGAPDAYEKPIPGVLKRTEEQIPFDLEPGTYKIVPPHNHYFSETEKSMSLSLFRPLMGSKQGDKIGFVEVQEDFSKLEKLCALPDFPNLAVYVLLPDGKLIFPGATEDVAAKIGTLAAKTVESGTLRDTDPVSRRDSSIIAKISQRFGFTLLLTVPNTELGKSGSFFGQQLLFTGLWGLFLIASLLVVITRKFTRPLLRFNASVRKVSFENLRIDTTGLDSGDELGLLTESVDHMLKTLGASMDQVVELRVREKNARLFALQAQIKPHFLFNALSVIAIAGRETGSKKVENMVLYLSDMLRYVTDFRSSTASLREETDYARYYLELIGMRYESRFTFTVQAAFTDEWNVQVPRLIIQPLLENCFEHGFQTTRPPWNIELVVRSDETGWSVSITDNGTGMSEEEGARLRERIDAIDPSKYSVIDHLSIGGLGIPNVVARLKNCFGDDFRFSMRSRSDGGSGLVVIIERKGVEPGFDKIKPLHTTGQGLS